MFAFIPFIKALSPFMSSGIIKRCLRNYIQFIFLYVCILQVLYVDGLGKCNLWSTCPCGLKFPFVTQSAINGYHVVGS